MWTAGPLPGADLASIDEIAGALTRADQADVAIVSMLHQLGIGVYEPDGTTIRSGSERSDDDLFLFEPEVQGLTRLLVEREAPSEHLGFREFHAGLAGLGFDGSAEDLATAYRSAYAAAPEAAMSRYVSALTTIDVDGSLSRVAMWLLVVDGFVAPSAASTATAMVGNAPRAIAAGQAGWGVARSRVQSVSAGVNAAEGRFIARLAAIAARWEMRATSSADKAHEGHGGLGAPVTMSAFVEAGAVVFTSPITHLPVVPVHYGGSAIDGIHITWQADATANAHGSLSQASSAVDGSGKSHAIYTPKQEQANGAGGLVVAPVGATASASKRELLERLYGQWALPYAAFVGDDVRGSTGFILEFHELAKAQIEIVWTDVYDGWPDTITFSGELTTLQDDSVGGALVYIGTGTATGSRKGWKDCNPGIEVVPSGSGPATFMGVVNGGMITISAFADYGTPLSGVSTGPFEVSMGGGQVPYGPTTPVGELCPHFSSGTITLKPLDLPRP